MSNIYIIRQNRIILKICSFCILIISILFYGLNIKANSQKQPPIRLTMDSAVLIGTTNSILLQTIHSKKETFKMMVTEKWRNFLPRVGVSYFGLKNLNYNQLDTAYNDVRLTVQQLLYDGGDTSLEVEIAKLQEISNAEDFKIAKQKLSFEIRKVYLETLLAGGKLYLTQRSYDRILSQFGDTSAQKNEGFSIELQKIELHSKFREVELAEEKAKGQYRLALFNLKQILNLDPSVDLILSENPFADFLLSPPSIDIDKLSLYVTTNREELKKSRISIEIQKKIKEKSENYWQPKISVGAYAGQNVNGFLPTKNDIYGFNFTVSSQLGSNTSKASGNYGVQTDGTGIQRIPGYGTQPVGRGDNAFNSADLHLWDDLSYARKILESKITLQESVGKHRALENELKSEVYKVHDKLKEVWYSIRIANSRVYLQYEALRIIQEKLGQGFSKKTDLISAELEFVKAEEDLADSLINYGIQTYRLASSVGVEPEEIEIFKIRKGKGNSILFRINPKNGGLGILPPKQQEDEFEDKKTDSNNKREKQSLEEKKEPGIPAIPNQRKKELDLFYED